MKGPMWFYSEEVSKSKGAQFAKKNGVFVTGASIESFCTIGETPVTKPSLRPITLAPWTITTTAHRLLTQPTTSQDAAAIFTCTLALLAAMH